MSDESDEPVWSGTVDNDTYACRVDRTAKYTGVLSVVRSADGVVVLQETVPLSYGAIFGPDHDDVRTWQTKCVEAIDEDYRHQGLEPPK